MQKRATLTVYDGSRFIEKTGKVIKLYENGAATIDDEHGVRWFAHGERVKIDGSGIDAGHASLW